MSISETIVADLPLLPNLDKKKTHTLKYQKLYKLSWIFSNFFKTLTIYVQNTKVRLWRNVTREVHTFWCIKKFYSDFLASSRQYEDKKDVLLDPWPVVHISIKKKTKEKGCCILLPYKTCTVSYAFYLVIMRMIVVNSLNDFQIGRMFHECLTDRSFLYLVSPRTIFIQ